MGEVLTIIGNIIWIIFGGFEMFLAYIIHGMAACLTLIGIPFGVQLFKLSLLALWPFGKATVEDPDPICPPSMLLCGSV